MQHEVKEMWKCHNEKQIPIVEESDEMTKDGKKPKSTDMTLEKKNRKNRQSAETSDDHGKAPTVKSKEIDKPKNKRNKRQTSETSDDSAQLSMSTANFSLKQRSREELEISQEILTILHNPLHPVEAYLHNLMLGEQLEVSQRNLTMKNPLPMMYRLQKIWHLHGMDLVVTFASRCSEIMMN